MSDRLEWFDVTIPASTPIASPFVLPLVFNDGIVTEIDLKILDGPCGTVGFFIMAGGSQYIPRTPGSFVIPNDDYLVWPVQNAITSGSWGITAYNQDSWPHLIQVAFHVNETGSPSLTPTTSGADAIDTLTSAMSVIVPGVSNQPSPLSPDALLNSLPLGSTVTSPLAPLDIQALLAGVGNGTS